MANFGGSDPWPPVSVVAYDTDSKICLICSKSKRRPQSWQT